MSSIEYIKSDLYRYKENTSFSTFIKVYLSNKSFRFQVWFRIATRGKTFKNFGRIVLFLKNQGSIVIPRQTEVGYGLYIGHGGPVVINPSTIIGNNVNLSQFTSIGTNSGKAAVIGDEVYIGPNVSIVGNVKIGDGATIGAGSVVVKDIPPEATAVGNYAKVINYDNHRQFVNRKWKCL